MRIGMAAAVALATAAGADEAGRPTALHVRPIQDALVLRGDDGMDHVEYDLLVTSVFAEPVTLTEVVVLDPDGAEIGRIAGAELAARTQTLFAKTPGAVVAPSGAVGIAVDLVVPPGTAPDRVTHRIVYALAPDTESAVMIGAPELDGPEVTVDPRPALVIAPPVRGAGWLSTSACCEPNVHRSLRVAVDGGRIATSEMFAVDFGLVRDGRIYDGDGGDNTDYYGFGAEVLAVADGTVVAVEAGKPDAVPGEPMTVAEMSDYGGNQVILEIGPGVFAAYGHLQAGSVAVEVGQSVTAGAVIGRLGNSGPSTGPHLHFGLLDQPNLWTGMALPFVFAAFEREAVVDLDASTGEKLAMTPARAEVRDAHPLVGRVFSYR